MEHIYENIQGWATYLKFYKSIVMNARDGDHIVEVGAWKGRSASYLAVEIANSGKHIRFDCVDTWKGSDEHQEGNFAYDPIVSTKGALLQHFTDNIKPVRDYINPVQSTSVEAAGLYANRSLDVVFIDAAHDYDSVVEDITLWLPKVKKGGILAGHDINYFEGVRRAIAEKFTDTENLTLDHEQDIWIYNKK
jgi:predicted O-methyltransferase YrrM